MPGSLNRFTYYGRGPWENYSDRNYSSHPGIYNSMVADQYVPYIRPQENGNKTDVRWFTLTNEEGEGIKIEGLGGDNSWGMMPHDQYRLRERKYSYGFIIGPVKNDN